MVSLDELLARSDFITVHLPKTPETLGLIGDEALHKVKPTVRIINAARGGIVDEQALADALNEGRVAGAGLDVYAKEPCTDSPALRLRPGRRHPAPRCLHRRGAGEGRHRRRAVRTARAGRRAGPGRRQRPGRRDRRGRTPGPAAHREARPDLHRPGRRLPRRRRRSRCAARSPSTTCRCSSCPPSRASSPTSSRSRSPTSTPRSWPRSAASRSRWSPTRRAPTTATWSPCAASWPRASSLGQRHPRRVASRPRRSSTSTATTST